MAGFEWVLIGKYVFCIYPAARDVMERYSEYVLQFIYLPMLHHRVWWANKYTIGLYSLAFSGIFSVVLTHDYS